MQPGLAEIEVAILTLPIPVRAVPLHLLLYFRKPVLRDRRSSSSITNSTWLGLAPIIVSTSLYRGSYENELYGRKGVQLQVLINQVSISCVSSIPLTTALSVLC